MVTLYWMRTNNFTTIFSCYFIFLFYFMITTPKNHNLWIIFSKFEYRLVDLPFMNDRVQRAFFSFYEWEIEILNIFFYSRNSRNSPIKINKYCWILLYQRLYFVIVSEKFISVINSYWSFFLLLIKTKETEKISRIGAKKYFDIFHWFLSLPICVCVNMYNFISHALELYDKTLSPSGSPPPSNLHNHWIIFVWKFSKDKKIMLLFNEVIFSIESLCTIIFYWAMSILISLMCERII